MEVFYRKRHPQYAEAPPFRADCRRDEDGKESPIAFIYPRNQSTVYIPKTLDAERSRVVFEVAHRDEDALLYWHLDDSFVGTTQDFHTMELNPAPGSHIITVMDERGSKARCVLHVLEKD